MAEVPSTAQRPSEAQADTKVDRGWKYLTFTKKNRVIPTQAKVKKPPTPSPPTSESEVSEDEVPVLSKSKRVIASSDDEAMDVDEPDQPDPVKEIVTATMAAIEAKSEDIAVPKQAKEDQTTKKRAPKAKASKKAKKARLLSPEPAPLVEIPIVPEPEVAEIHVAPPQAPSAAAHAVLEPSKPKAKRPTASPIDKLISGGTVADEEDAFWLGQALAGIEPQEELEPEKDTTHPLYHEAGSWRAQGWKKIPQIEKSKYLPQRNKAQVRVEEASGSALTTGRTARVTGRRLAHDMESHRKTTASSSATAESDLFAFNQLRIRKKQLRFARSAIEGYGLYAMETIHAGEMVCEYVGEICRSAVADIREQRYLKQGIGSSYLFRIDGDMVCDATFRGSVR